jgi:energy-coupling factor transporter ATP-binding protein EcfA2
MSLGTSLRLRSFALKGLHGYKDLSIDCGDLATIFLAENGVGKTTLLNTLYALLSGRISRLAPLVFDEAVLTFEREEIVFKRETAFKATEQGSFVLPLNNRIIREMAEYGVPPEQVIELAKVYVEQGREALQAHPWFVRIWRASPFGKDEMVARFDRLRASIYNHSYITEFRSKVKAAMGTWQVLYLPTYRRIEATFEDMTTKQSSKRIAASQSDDEEAETDQLIYFGLGDVEEKLQRITRVIQQSMFEAYSRLSGNMLDALLGMRQFELASEAPLDLEPVRLMLGRLGKSNTITQAELEKALNTATLSEDRNRPLAYFLRQLLSSYEESRAQELEIEEFVAVVNGYFETALTDKRLRFDKVRLKVDVWHEALQKSLPFGSLSSGEKQVVSVFARLVLDANRQYIILIDEPELSLSIEWQRRFLPDILRTRSCAQLLAITHSPFVFENELDQSARSITILNSPAR